MFFMVGFYCFLADFLKGKPQGKGVRNMPNDDHPSQQKTSRLPYLSIPHAPFGIDSSK